MCADPRCRIPLARFRQRVSAATNATTLGELQSLVSDLQIHKAPVQLPRLKSPARCSAVDSSVPAPSQWGQ
jgi:hypothetical protein